MNAHDFWPQILASPHDKSLKAHYLLALKEARDERGEMFQLAEEIAEFRRGSYFGKAEALTPRYQELLAGWTTRFENAAATWPAKVTFRHAWPIELSMKASDFAQHAPAIVATLPLRHLTLSALSDSPEVFNLPQLAQIATLDISNQPLSPQTINALAASTHLTSLRWLNLSHTGIIDPDVEILAAAETLRSVRYIDLRDNPSRDPVDASLGCGYDGITGGMMRESISLPDFGRELEARYGRIIWLNALDELMETFPISRYKF